MDKIVKGAERLKIIKNHFNSVKIIGSLVFYLIAQISFVLTTINKQIPTEVIIFGSIVLIITECVLIFSSITTYTIHFNQTSFKITKGKHNLKEFMYTDIKGIKIYKSPKSIIHNPQNQRPTENTVRITNNDNEYYFINTELFSKDQLDEIFRTIKKNI